jgi:hypothetical protein
MAAIINTLNAILLSFRFDKKFKHVEDITDESLMSGYFSKRSR